MKRLLWLAAFAKTGFKYDAADALRDN